VRHHRGIASGATPFGQFGSRGFNRNESCPTIKFMVQEKYEMANFPEKVSFPKYRCFGQLVHGKLASESNLWDTIHL
jgi:hypothetical protein